MGLWTLRAKILIGFGEGRFEDIPNRAKFLVELYHGELPFSNDNTEKVKEIMLVEVHENHQISAKTGLGIKNNEVIGGM